MTRFVFRGTPPDGMSLVAPPVGEAKALALLCVVCHLEYHQRVAQENVTFALLCRTKCSHLNVQAPLLWSGGFPALRTFMNLLSVSNQKGAPSDTAKIVISHPPKRFFSRYQIQHQNPAVVWPGQSLYQSPCQPAT